MKRRHITWVLVPLALAGIIILAAQRSEYGINMLQQFAPALLPSSQLARNLERTDPGVVRESLATLARRKDPVGTERAIALLKNPDPYVWLNAAHYLGGIGRQEAVPYLIKGLRHSAWRSDAERVVDLERITGQSLGTNFAAWSNWWVMGQTNVVFDFESSLGAKPRK